MNASAIDTGVLQALVEFAYAAGHLGYREEDSREVFTTLLEWARLFEDDFRVRVTRGDIEEDLWLEEIDQAINDRFSHITEKLSHPGRLDTLQHPPTDATPAWLLQILGSLTPPIGHH